VIVFKTKLILRLSRKKMKEDYHNEIWVIKGIDKRNEVKKKKERIFIGRHKAEEVDGSMTL